MDYDMSIHTNPSAEAWARFYVESRVKWEAAHPEAFLQRFDTEENMIGWFANAMMAMHDSIKGGPAVLPDGSAFFVGEVTTPPEGR